MTKPAHRLSRALAAVLLASGVLQASEPDAAHQKAAARLKELGAEIDEGEEDGKPYCIVKFESDWKGKADDLRELAALAHLGSVLIGNDAGIGDAGLKQLAGLKKLAILSIYDAKVTDAGIANLGILPRLEWLILERLKLTDAGLKTIRKFKTLKTLVLDGTRITDAGLAELAPLKNLEALRVSNTSITDVGLRHLTVFKKLRVVGASETKITVAGVQELEMAVPICKVLWDGDDEPANPPRK